MAQLNKVREPRLSSTATLPPEITVRLLADVDAISSRMTRYIISGADLRDERFRSTAYLRTLTAACRDAFRTLVRLLNDGRGMRQGDLDRLGSMGAQQAELGVPLEVVFSAYRVAAKVVWQEIIGEPALVNEVSAATVVAVTGRVLEYLDEISAAVGSAYLATRERLMRQRDRDRDRVLQRLVAGDAPADMRRLAAATDLDLQPPYRVVACSTADGNGEQLLEATWRRAGGLLTSDDPGVWMALVPPDKDLAAISQQLPTASFGVGPVAATLEEVAGAAAQARRALEVGTLLEPERQLHRDSDVGVFAALTADPGAMRHFVDGALGPVLSQKPARRDELVATLEAVLDARSIGDAAAALEVHRHTIVYRLSRLREMGIDVDDPPQRHALWLALRCLRLLHR